MSQIHSSESCDSFLRLGEVKSLQGLSELIVKAENFLFISDVFGKKLLPNMLQYFLSAAAAELR